MKRSLLYIIVCAVLLFPVTGGAGGRTMPIVFEDYPPYEYAENGVVKGINIDLIREAFRRMGMTPTFEPRPWKRALFELKQGNILAVCSGFKTPQREGYAIYPSEALAVETNVVMALTVSGVNISSLKDLRGLRIGVVREYVYGHEFDSMQGLEKIVTTSNPQLLRMLLDQRMDVIVGNRVVLDHLARKMGKTGHIRTVFTIGSEALYLFFSRARSKETEPLARKFGQAIRAMHKDGTFEAIESRY